MEIKNTEVLEKFISPIVGLVAKNAYSRNCPEVSDLNWIKLGIMRVLSKEESGRGFLEDLFFDNGTELSAGHFFETLKSNRRLKFTNELNKMLTRDELILSENNDSFKGICELDNFELYAGDGHHHEHPEHEEKIDNKAYSTQHFYALNLRTEMVTHIDVAEYGNTRKKEHDMRMLKRQKTDSLRQGAKRGRKVLYVWDRAGIDYRQWYNWKASAGIYFLSREKENFRPQVIGEPEFNKDDEVNNGVLANQMIGPANSESLRRIIYQCPESCKIFVFLTNLPLSIPPGVIAFLYKCRWNLEKVYNTYKHKFNEKKAWAKSMTAKSIQANFICLTYNLSVILNRRIEKDANGNGLQINTHHYERKQKRINELVKKAIKNKMPVSTLLLKITNLTELPKKFYRWLRKHVLKKTSWREAVRSICLSYAMN